MTAPVVTCARCGETKPSLPRPPMPRETGQLIQAHTCAGCWDAWKEEQVRLINHHGLRPHLPEDRARLYGFLREFLKLPAA